MNRKMRVLVTGATGFLGRHIVERLIQDNIHVVALVRRPTRLDDWFKENVEYIMGDLRDQHAIASACNQIDAIIHAAITFAGDWDNFHKINVEATDTLLNHSVKNKVIRFIYISSVSIYRHAHLTDDQVFSEDMPYEEEKDTSYYSRSKIEAEKLVREYGEKHHLPFVILRPGAIYGPGGELFPATIGLPVGSDKILMFGNSNSKLPLSYVENVSDVVYKSLTNDSAQGECFNLVEDHSLTRNEYYQRLKRDVHPKIRKIKLPYLFFVFMKFSLKTAFSFIGRKAPLSDLNLKMFCSTINYSNKKMKNVFGEKPYIEFDESLKRTFEHFRTKMTPKRSTGFHKGKMVLPSEKKLKVGVIGCGYISFVHLKVLKKLKNTDLIALADPNKKALETMAKKYSIENLYDNYTDMLAKESLDAVHILAPPQFHAKMAIDALEAGCHVIIEKPMALSGTEAEAMRDLAVQKGLKLSVVHNFLYNDVMFKARELIATGKLGQIINVESWYGTMFGSDAPPFSIDTHWMYKLPGSLYQDFIAHPIYLLLDIIGEAKIVDVHAKLLTGVPGMKTDEMKIVFENSHAYGLLTFSMSASPRYHHLFVYGTDGSMKVDFINNKVYLHKNIGVFPETFSRTFWGMKEALGLAFSSMMISFEIVFGKFSYFNGTKRLIHHFYRSILLDEEPPVPGDEGLQVIQLMDQIWQQLETTSSLNSNKKVEREHRLD